MPNNFGSRLQETFKKSGQLCLGIDPHASILDAWSLPDNLSGLEVFSKKVIEAAVDRVGVIKPQVGFFERFGSGGFKVLEQVSEYAKEAKLICIMDAKRGDIGSTMQGYFEAWLGKSAPFAADALTVSPYLGFDSLLDVFSQAHELGRGIFVLAATSNPEGAALQTARKDGITLAADIWNSLNRINSVTNSSQNTIGDFGAVVGATINFAKLGLNEIPLVKQKVGTPILSPGFGAQGAELTSAKDIFGVAVDQVLFSVSRSVLEAGPLGIGNSIDLAKKQLAIGLG